MTRALKQFEYNQFVTWYAMPAPFRKTSGVPKNQKQMARSLKVSEVVLSRWKRDPSFAEDVKRERLNWAKEQTADVIYALYQRAIAGKAADVKLWMGLFENFKEKTVEEKEVGDNLADIIKRELAERKLS